MSSVKCQHVSIDELVSLNDRLAFAFRSMGLKDHELDQAIVELAATGVAITGSFASKTQADAIEIEGGGGVKWICWMKDCGARSPLPDSKALILSVLFKRH